MKRNIAYILLVLLFSIQICEAKQKKWIMNRVSIDGNKSFSERELLSLMELKPRILFFRNNVFTEWKLRSDVNTIRNFYSSQGFPDAVIVVSSVVRDTARGRVNVALKVSEGIRITISGVQIEPLDSLFDSSAVLELSTKYGKYLTTSSISRDIDYLMDSSARCGYLDAVVESSIEFDTAQYRAKVLFSIKKGPKIRVGAVRIIGREKLRKRFITRELKFRENDVLTSEKIRKSEQNLYRTNLLDAVQIEHRSGKDSTHDSGSSGELSCPVTVRVQEADFFKIQAGVGYSYLGSSYKYYEGFRGQLETSYSNLFALGHRIALKTNASFPEQNAQLVYTTPWFFYLPVQVDSKIYLNRFAMINADTAIIRGVELAFIYQVNVQKQYRLRFKWEDMPKKWFKPNNRENSAPKDLTQAVGTDIIHDTRNDLADPSGGFYNSFSCDVAGLANTNSNRYLKTVDDFRYYWKWRKIRFGSGIRLGWIYAYDRKHKEIPPQEQFIIGGSKTLRGFTEADSLHTEKGFMFSANIIEMRIPLFWWFSGALFVDAGNVWDISHQRPFIDGLKGIRWSAGPGIRLKTPLAIVRMDIGFKIGRNKGEQPFEFHFDLGQAF